ncbi:MULTISPECIES: hypothetical protein [unclassified Anabaena]|uniref:hypothetical protein n=1 Tax=unclassified Anabaena TaxID=2619674 RepID=UPI0039C6D949
MSNQVIQSDSLVDLSTEEQENVSGGYGYWGGYRGGGYRRRPFWRGGFYGGRRFHGGYRRGWW